MLTDEKLDQLGTTGVPYFYDTVTVSGTVVASNRKINIKYQLLKKIVAISIVRDTEPDKLSPEIERAHVCEVKASSS